MSLLSFFVELLGADLDAILLFEADGAAALGVGTTTAAAGPFRPCKRCAWDMIFDMRVWSTLFLGYVCPDMYCTSLYERISAYLVLS